MLSIHIEVIPHDQQRYPTCGDWEWHDNTLTVKVSDLGSWTREALVGIHEAIEAVLCRAKGITTSDVDLFDIEYERKREKGDFSEPGDDIAAPYYVQHQVATGVERMMAALMNVPWREYEASILSLK